MTRWSLPLRPELRDAEPYGAPQLDVAVRLHVNENPYPPSEELARDLGAAVQRLALRLNRYPDREATELRAALAGYLGHQLGVRQVWAANGSNEIMTQILQAFGGPDRSLLSFRPTYSMYPEYARNTHTTWVTATRTDDFEIDVETLPDVIATHQPNVVIVASPNNPTGTALPLATVRAICEHAPGVVVVDEAYAEFRRPGSPSALSVLDAYPMLAVTRTMSKAFALAGARCGYVAASPQFVDALRIVRLPYHLSDVTQVVARTALSHAGELMAAVGRLRDERDALVAWLRGIGLRVADSDANFVLFGQFTDRHRTWQGLLERGVLIREVGPDGWLRVSVGTSAEMAAFRAALSDVLEEVSV